MAYFKDQQILKLQKLVDQNRLMIFMQDKLAEMRSKFMTQVAIRVKPCPENATETFAEDIQPEPFNILSSSEMGMAKQIVINDSGY